MADHAKLHKDAQELLTYLRAHPPQDVYLNTLLISLLNTLLDFSEP